MSRIFNWRFPALLAVLSASFSFAADPPAPTTIAPPAAAAVVTDPVVLNTGPIHEAFAVPAAREAVIPKGITARPPDAIDERPPLRQPVGETVRWIPGYWAYEPKAQGFVWVSGVWREVPPGRTWVPGYWTQSADLWRWVPGNWTDTSADQVTYLPEPPATQEAGPTSASPGEGYFWVPGSWQYVDNKYVWQPGFWAPHQRDWIWVPPRYTYTPLGYIYTSGYWDYVLAYRGIAFAPVSFKQLPADGPYTPSVALDTWRNLSLHLFISPQRDGYYFGDYYDAEMTRLGFVPFFTSIEQHEPEPLLSYYTWRLGDDYASRLRDWHRYYTDYEQFRPRYTLADQLALAARYPGVEYVASTSLVAPFDDVIRLARSPYNFADVTNEQLVLYTDRTKRLRDFIVDRVEAERVVVPVEVVVRPSFPIRASKFLKRP